MAEEILSDPTPSVGLSAEWRRRLGLALEATYELDAATTVMIGLASDPPPQFNIYARGQAVRLRDLARAVMNLVSDGVDDPEAFEHEEVIFGRAHAVAGETEATHLTKTGACHD